MSESKIGKQVQAAWSREGNRLWRNNVGVGWVGKSIFIKEQCGATLYPGDVIIRQARPLHAGLCEGSADYIGFRRVVITPEMVGKTLAVFSSVETKVPKTGKLSAVQQNWQQMVNDLGGIGIVATSVEESLK